MKDGYRDMHTHAQQNTFKLVRPSECWLAPVCGVVCCIVCVSSFDAVAGVCIVSSAFRRHGSQECTSAIQATRDNEEEVIIRGSSYTKDYGLY